LKRKRRPKVNLFLVKPSFYDDEGYVVRYFRGVLPSNTLACLAGLTEMAKTGERLAGIDLRVHLIDEAVSKVNVSRLARPRRGITKTIVCLVGIQTSQFPRAADLAKAFRRHGATVMMGGFHLSGYLKMTGCIPADVQELMDLGVTIVKGEVEEAWGNLLAEAVEGTLKSLYDYLDSPPDLTHAPIPVMDRRYLKRFVLSRAATIDCGRGCPYKCTFCTIINVQGRKMRIRSPEAIGEALRKNYREDETTFYFFTDDNFARNANWEGIFDLMIELREKENIPLTFMMQVDVLSHRIKGFVEKAARAGCSNVFIGMESLNPANLKAAGKNQNLVEDFKGLLSAYRNAGVFCHVGYILGFPYDTRESILADLDRLMNDLQVDMASFFILTPLPGSADHLRMLRDGSYLDPDFNRYDSFRETMRYPGFPEEGSLQALYDEVWRRFYSFENMSAILNRATVRRYWDLFRNFLWYRAAVLEKRHPMAAGFVRMKGRLQLRPGLKPLNRLAYLRRRTREVKHSSLAFLSLILEMQLLWLETRKQSDLEKKIVAEWRELGRTKIKLRDLQAVYFDLSSRIPSVQVPSGFRLFFQKWSPFSLSLPFYRREEILEFWGRTLTELRQGKAFVLARPAVFKRVWLDSKLCLHFLRACLERMEGHPR
jgi:radical SAM superfamily enzyme YgiQ (UPF0313 family)